MADPPARPSSEIADRLRRRRLIEPTEHQLAPHDPEHLDVDDVRSSMPRICVEKCADLSRQRPARQSLEQA